jgi:phosphoglycolate phosphatase-like HAD superfamily hydrolase
LAKKAIMFDFDGTLVDSMNELAEISSNLLNRYFEIAVPIAKRLYIETSGLPFCEQVEIIFPGSVKNSSVVKEFEELKESTFWKHRLFPDVPDVLEYLKAMGYIVAVSSSNFEYIIREYMEKQGVEAHEVLGFIQEKGFTKGKPHFDYIHNKHGIDFSDIVFVGDSIKDGLKAISCGVYFIGKTGINKREQFISALGDINVIDSLSELKEIL